jgi:hypothetical protein
MGNVNILIRGKATKTRAGQFKEAVFADLGNGKVRDEQGREFQMVVTRPDGGVLRNGPDFVAFRFPR